MTRWTERDIPSQRGKTAIVTGANSGIGFHTALELARAGAGVVLSARDRAKGEDARRRILTEVPAARVELGILDLADLGSVRRFAAEVPGRVGRWARASSRWERASSKLRAPITSNNKPRLLRRYSLSICPHPRRRSLRKSLLRRPAGCQEECNSQPVPLLPGWGRSLTRVSRGRERPANPVPEHRQSIDGLVAEHEADVTIGDLATPASHRRGGDFLL